MNRVVPTADPGVQTPAADPTMPTPPVTPAEPVAPAVPVQEPTTPDAGTGMPTGTPPAAV